MKSMLGLAICSALLMSAGESVGEVRALVPSDWQGAAADSWQMKRHAAKLSEIKERGGAPLVFLGDSITHFWENDPTWTNLLNVAQYDALNLGYSGDRTEHVLWRITEGRELDGYEAAVIVVMIGTNNTGHFPLEKESPMDTIRGIREIVRLVREKQPNALVILHPIFPRGETPDDPCRLRNGVVNSEIKKIADGDKIVWVDMAKDFLEDSGVLPRRLFPDLLHPITPAYEIWFLKIKPYVDRALEQHKATGRRNVKELQ